MKLCLSTIFLHIEIRAWSDVIYAYSDIPDDFYFAKIIRK